MNVVIHDPKIFFWIAASVSDAPGVNPNGIKILMANALSKFFIKVRAAFSNGFILYNWLSSYTVDCPILYN